jgi:hypothetical protein
MQIIPITDVYSQTVNVTLANQPCTINLYQKSTGFYCDLYINNALVIGGVVCRNLTKIVRDAYLGFTGDLMFYDTQGAADPSSPGIGTRFVLCYLELADIT